MGLLDDFAALRSDVASFRTALGRHQRVPEARWGIVTVCSSSEIRVGWPEGGDCVITQSAEAVWVGAHVLVQVQGRDRWITALSGGVLPAGVSAMFSGLLANVPAGWKVKDGSAISRATYWRLYAALGGASSPHGQGDGSTTFNLPNQSGRVSMGTGTAPSTAGATAHTLGQVGGEETHAMTANENGPHWHNVGVTQADDGVVDALALQETATVSYGGWAFTLQSTGGGYRKFIADSQGSGIGHNNLPPYLAEIPIIKF